LVHKDSIVDDDPEKYLVIYPPIATNQQGFFAATAKKKVSSRSKMLQRPRVQGEKLGKLRGNIQKRNAKSGSHLP
jgi:hypothetical protein